MEAQLASAAANPPAADKYSGIHSPRRRERGGCGRGVHEQRPVRLRDKTRRARQNAGIARMTIFSETIMSPDSRPNLRVL